MSSSSSHTKRKGILGLLRPFFGYFRPYRITLIPVALGCALEVLFNAQIPLSVKFMIDKALIAKDQRMMFWILGALAVGAVVVSLSSLGRDYLYAKIVNRITSDLRLRMFDRLQRLSMDYYARTEVGDLMSRFSNDISAVQRGLAVAVSWGLQPLMDLVLLTTLVYLLEWRLATIGFLLCSLVVVGPQFFARRTAELSLGKQQEESRIMITLQETISAPALIRAFNLQERTVGTFRERNSLLLGASFRLSFLSSVMDRSTSVAILLLQVIVMGFSGFLAFRGDISIGTFASFQALFLSLSFAFAYLAQYMPQLINSSGGVERIQEFLDEKPKVEDAPNAPPLPPLDRAIQLSSVTFRYAAADPKARPNLEHVSLEIARGSTVALVGPSGSGKSTILNMLLRFYDPSDGALLFDGVDLRQASQASLREQMAVVFQESFLFNTTIRENIALGKPEASDAEIIAAARAAEIHDFISTLPEGYQTLAGERGGRFSGGQRQRIAIARAVLKNPSILLLDEATSALDADTEHSINTTLERVARGRTMVSVTHRLRSVLTMDKVYVLDQGRVVEAGCHTELLEKGGVYAKMWQKQSGVRLEDGEKKATVDVAWLADLPLLKGVRPESLAEIAKWFGTEQYAEDRVIVQEGEPGASFYILVRGTVEVTRLENGHPRRLAKLQDGDCFGEMALLSNKPRNATVRTLTPCVCLSLKRDLFDRLLEREPELQDHIRTLSARRAAADAVGASMGS